MLPVWADITSCYPVGVGGQVGHPTVNTRDIQRDTPIYYLLYIKADRLSNNQTRADRQMFKLQDRRSNWQMSRQTYKCPDVHLDRFSDRLIFRQTVTIWFIFFFPFKHTDLQPLLTSHASTWPSYEVVHRTHSSRNIQPEIPSQLLTSDFTSCHGRTMTKKKSKRFSQKHMLTWEKDRCCLSFYCNSLSIKF